MTPIQSNTSKRRRNILPYFIGGLTSCMGGITIFLLSWSVFQALLLSVIFFIGFLINDTRGRMRKVDKGVEIIYAILSNRRKFKRDAWGILFAIIVIAMVWFLLSIELWRKVSISFIFLGTYIIILFYSFLRWKKDTNY